MLEWITIRGKCWTLLVVGFCRTTRRSYWALDPATGNLWALPDLGRGAWENATALDTGREDRVALLLADDFGTSDSSFANQPAPPLYLYIGKKNPAGDFLERNGLRGGVFSSGVPTRVTKTPATSTAPAPRAQAAGSTSPM